MSTQAPVPQDAPLMVAWNAYKASEEYANTEYWATRPEHTEDSLWAAFVAGFNAAHSPSDPQRGERTA